MSLQELESYRQLWVSVINQAIDDLRPRNKTSQSEYWKRRAKAWMLDTGNNVGSLQWICDHIGMDSGKIISAMEQVRNESH